ncbi:type VI secretion system Vgr family protein [Sorangium sp. So ce233]|uniref:type VI secretion system Vgr family protein n=1 Tax=Sorangium sp. So ce233 TaxID=3133290 RepID=UPI003F602E6A
MPNVDLTFASGESSLSVRRFSVREAVSDCFVATVWACSPDPSLDLKAIAGKPASLRVEAGLLSAQPDQIRHWSGVCSYIEQTHAEPTGVSTYRLSIVPSLWLLGKRRNYRIFQHVTIPDIVNRLLAEWEIDHQWAVDRAAYPRLEFRVQYGESDYGFLCRLLEEAGIAFTFPDGGGQGTKLTLGDRLHEGLPRIAPPLPYADNPIHGAEGDFATRVRLRHEVRPTAVVLRDHDFRNPNYHLFGKATKTLAPEDHLEQFRYTPGAFLIETDKGGRHSRLGRRCRRAARRSVRNHPRRADARS